MSKFKKEDEDIILFKLEREYCMILRSYNKGEPSICNDLLKLSNELQFFLKKDFFSDEGKEFLENVLDQSRTIYSRLPITNNAMVSAAA